MVENAASSDVARLAQRVAAGAEVIRARTKRLYRDADLLRRLTAQHEANAAALAAARSDTPGGTRA
jgi:hypothetical protein